MSDEVAIVERPLHRRVGHGMRKPRNWWQLLRFGAVGASGYVVNLATFWVALHVLSVDYRPAAVLAFLVAVANNFWWNRHWTFGAGEGHAGFQAARFFVVSVIAFGVSFAVLTVLVDVVGIDELAAQALSIIAATPLNFAGNKLWSFNA